MIQESNQIHQRFKKLTKFCLFPCLIVILGILSYFIWSFSSFSSICYLNKPGSGDVRFEIINQKNATGNKENTIINCGRTYPLDIEWIDPDFLDYKISNCDAKNVGFLEEVRKCFSSRTVYFLGNSIARHFAFGLAEIFGNPPVSRENQKSLCPKSNLGGTITCSIPLNEQTNIVSSWFLYFDGHVEVNSSYPQWEYDVCASQSTLTCLKSIIPPNAHENDVLITNIGIIYLMYQNYPFKFDEENFRVSAALRFIENVKKIFSGKVILMDVSPMRGSYLARAQVYNHQIIRTILKHTDWYVYDSYSVNRDLTWSKFYIDEFHFPGNLTLFGLSMMSKMLCS
jgi:hypothetical protein